jgi:putative DNA primase/helicase
MGAPKTNAEFLSAVHASPADNSLPWVCEFESYDSQQWGGFAWARGVPIDGAPKNRFYTLATYRRDAAGAVKRDDQHCAAVAGVMLDDIGTKVSRNALDPAPPSVLIQTSVGNAQAVYLFPEPVADVSMADALLAALLAKGLGDPNAKSASTRYCRLPFGWNSKRPGPPHLCGFLEWAPQRRYSIEELTQAFDLSLEPVAKERRQVSVPTAYWDSLDTAQQNVLLADVASALEHIPSDDYDDWIDAGHYLKSLPMAVGFALFEHWSRKSSEFNEGDQDRFYGFNTDRSDIRSLFTLATKHGWENPRFSPERVFHRANPIALPAGASLTPIVPAARVPAPITSAAVRLTRGDAVEMKPVQWLWPGFLPAAMLSIIGGATGCGKTTIALSLAATITKGDAWPDGTSCSAPGDVLVWSGEDPQSVLAARLTAMGANLSRVYFVDGVGEGEAARAFDPGRDMAQLEQVARSLPAPRLLIVDPIVSAVAGDAHKSNEVRRALQPVVDLGQRLGCAVIGITHFTKGTAGRDPVERVTGSIAFAALARLVMVAARVKGEGGERRVFVRAKSNIGPDDGGFVYTLERVPVQFAIEGQLVRWIEPLQGSASEALAEAERTDEREEDGTKAEIRDFVRQVIASREGRPVPSIDFEHEATTAGLKWAKVRAGLPRMGITRRKTPGTKTGGWYWEISNQAEWDKNASP